MPFLSEEIWHFIAPRNKEQALTITSWPKNKKFDQRQIELFSLAKNVVAGIRNFRKQYNISFKQSIDIFSSSFITATLFFPKKEDSYNLSLNS